MSSRLGFALALVVTGCQSAATPPATQPPAPASAPVAASPAAASGGFTLTSPGFGNGQAIPRVFTCQDRDVAPALAWSGAPKGTKSFALIVDDPDAPVAGGWVHWLVYDIPADRHDLPQGAAPAGVVQGKNSFGTARWGGPCPPPGGPHRYFFKLYALDTMLALPPGASRAALEAAMKGHVVGEATLMGRYARR
jgi:Raf kinase inhibitor-like YbhB/YbcL family protein